MREFLKPGELQSRLWNRGVRGEDLNGAELQEVLRAASLSLPR